MKKGLFKLVIGVVFLSSCGDDSMDVCDCANLHHDILVNERQNNYDGSYQSSKESEWNECSELLDGDYEGNPAKDCDCWPELDKEIRLKLEKLPEKLNYGTPGVGGASVPTML